MIHSIIHDMMIKNNIFKRNTSRLLRHCALCLALCLGTVGAKGQTTAHATGVDGDIVYLNDLEDHSWSYYSDASCPIRSLNPADVKITYYGNGQDANNMTTTDAGNTPTTFGAKATGVQVGPSDAANTFVYYKTLERANADGSGNLAYTAIPNPFQVRPTGTSGTVTPTTRTVYISGQSRGNGSISVSYTDANNTAQTWSDNSTDAVTTSITVKTGTTLTVTASGRSVGWVGYNYSTITARYDNEDGTQIATVTCSNNNYTRGASATREVASTTITISADRGFYAWRIKSLSSGLTIVGKNVGDIVNAEEEINFVTDNATGNEVEFEALWAQAYVTTGTGNLSTYVPASVTSAYERNFHIVNTSTAASYFQKNYPCTVIGRAPNSTTLNATRTITGGFTAAADTKFEDVVFGNATNSTYTANAHDLIIGRGCSGTVQNLYGATSAPSSNFKLRVESGTFTSSYLLYFDRSTQVNSAITMTGIYGCDYDRANNTNTNLTFSNVVEVGYRAYFTSSSGKINTTVLSGSFGSNADNHEFYLGFENGGDGTSQAVRTLDVYGGDFQGGIAGGFDMSGNTASSIKVNMRIRGGEIHRYLYGAGQYSECSGARRIIITGGAFDGWIAGGAFGTNDSGGATNGDIYLYFGGKASQTNTDGIFGAGYGTGNYVNGQNYYTVQASNVVFADEASTTGSVYGGGNNGFARDDIKVYVAGGHVAGNVFGGANKAPSSKDVAVVVKGGTVDGGVYGGSNQSGAISGQITVDVYGTDSQPETGYAINQVFGGGNVAAYTDTPIVTVHCGNNISIGEVYGGGNQAAVNSTDVTIAGGNRIGYVYGGGRQANVNGNTSVKIEGGTIEHVFGGNNISGNITGTLSVNVERGGDDCLLKVGELYGGGNHADSKAGSITIGCTGVFTDNHNNLSETNRIGYELEGIGDVYGGANEANITSGDITLNVNSGMISRVFGGNNTSGSISGTITVNIEQKSNACGWYVGNVFGGGNLATYTGNPAVNILNGTVSGNVYGGGNGDPNDATQVKGSTGAAKVTVGDLTPANSAYQAIVLGDVYGGGNAAKVTGDTAPTVLIQKCNTEVGYVYGGGNAADVPATNVTINGGIVSYDVYGGGHGDNTVGGEKAANVNGNVSVSITGGKAGRVFAGSNLNGAISGTVALNINKADGACDMIIGEVYGGGNQAAGNAGAITIGCTGTWTTTGEHNHTNANDSDNRIGYELEGIGTVYGGANQANVGNDITLNITGGIVENAFGGNNTSGTIDGDIMVNVEWGGASCDNYLGNVYGGGNLAPYTQKTAGHPAVNIKNGTVTHNVYGGGKGASAIVTGNPIVIIGDANASHYAIVGGDVYGGGDAAAVTGNTSVTYNDNNASSTVAKLFGGGNAAGVSGTTTVTMTSGKVTAGIYGGCNTSGDVLGNIIVNINAGTLGVSGTPLTSGIFGGGYGKDTETEGNVTVTIGDLAGTKTPTIYGDIYGGSALGNVNNEATDITKVDFLNGTLHGYIYGGGLGSLAVEDDTNTPDVNESAPAIAAKVNGQVIVNIGNETQTAENCRINLSEASIYGCNNTNGSPQADVTVNVYKTGHTTENAASYRGNDATYAIDQVFGGGNQAAYSPAASSNKATVHVYTCDNTVRTIYGGGNAADATHVGLIIDGGRFDRIFGGGNGYSSTNNHTDPNAPNYNPGANITGSATTQIHGGIYNQVFGGSNQFGNVASASLSLDANSSCNELVVNESFGGANEAEINGDVTTTLACTGNSSVAIGSFYGGSNKANITGSVTLNVYGGIYTNVFGGSKGVADNPSTTENEGISADIGGNVTLNLYGGTMENAFGGSDANGRIGGKITVTMLNLGGECPLTVYNIYGGGRDAAYTPTTPGSYPEVNILHGTVSQKTVTEGETTTYTGGNVFGGGLGETATVTSNPKVTVGYDANTMSGLLPNSLPTGYSFPDPYLATVKGNVYGGGSLASVAGSTTVLIQKDNSVIDGRVFGAGKGSETDAKVASVSKNATVTMTNGWVKTNIYGGGEMASVGTYTRDAQNAITAVTANTGTTTVTINGGTVGPDGLNPTNIDGNGNVFGGGLGKAGDAYSNSAYVNTSYVNVTNGTVRGSVFGGGENGHVKGDTHVTIGGGEVGVRVIHEYRDIHTDFGSGKPLYAGNVYGGGRGVDHTAVGNHLSETAGRVYGNTNVSVTGGHIYHAVYGGGSLASVGTYTLTADNSIFGGHLHNFTDGTGDATVSVSGGRIGPNWEDLYYDDDGNSLVDATGVPVSDAAKATIARNFECLGENEGMVYGSGRGMNYPNDNNTDHQLYVEMAFTNNTFVTIKGDNTEVVGSVFGGGENGHVKGNTQVNIQGGNIGGFRLHHNGFYLPGHMNEAAYFIEDTNVADDEMTVDVNGTGKVIFRGNVYGGGRGVDHINAQDPTQAQQIYSISAGRVYGNTEVNITGGHVLHNVFGGGSIASVGTYSYPVSGGNPQFLNENPESCWANTGKATVNVTGGMVGQMGENEGYVYGGGRGVAGSSDAQVKHLAYVNETEVNIGTGTGIHADVRGSVFGGGMNGHVLTDTHVTVSGGVVGGKTDEDYGTYDTVNFPLADKPTQADYTIDGVSYYCGIIKGDMVLSEEGVGAHNVYLGNVYGGGRGVDHYGASNTNLSRTAGRVYGNTNLTVTGGVIYHSIFGGGSIASVGTYTLYTDAEAVADAAADERYRIIEGQPKECVGGGTATVTVTGGRIGTDGHNNGRVFGSSRGMAGTNYRGLGYVNKTNVTIGTSGASTGPEVRGSVFGSGENGHVLTTTQVNIESGHIGNGKATTVTDHYVGNVYGGGRGLDRAVSGGETVSPFAGRVYGTTTVNVRGGQIDHNVYGGGSLASVGRFKRYMANTSDERYNTITYADANVGICYVNVSGGTIGIDGDNNGHVFGSSRGTAASHRDILASLAYVSDTRVTISGGTVKGSVFGGGESGHVQRDATVTVSGGTIGSAIPKDYSACTDAEKKMYDLMGNVYGAGRGVDTYEDNNGVEQYSFSAGYVRGNTTVEITGGTIHRNVYGGGSMGIVGDYGPYGRNDFFEGDPATNGLAKVTIKSAVGTADDVAHGYGGNVFGSSRGKANDPVNDSTHDFAEMSYCFQTQVNVDTGADVLGNVYGGGENGHVDYAGTTVTVKNGRVRGNVFGGGKGNISSATAGIIDGPTRVLIGTPEQQTNTVVIDGDVFAGNDTHSSPLGEMRVDVYKANAALNNVYGGGNLANVLTGVAANDVTTGYDVMNTDYITQRIEQSSTPASFTPWPGGTSRKSVVYVHTGNHAIGSVFGGGKMANCKLTEVTIDGGVTTDVYGGGEQGDVTETTRVDLVSGTVTDVYGGGLGKKNGFFGSTEDVAADVGGNVIVNLNGGSSVTSPSNNCVVKGSIFGCNNLNGTPKGHVTVHVYKTQGWTGHNVSAGKSNATIAKGTGVYEVATVYGGGNMAAYVPTDGTETTDVIIDGCDLTSIEYVYGGGNAASVSNAKVTVNGTYEIGTVFGGGNGKDQLPNGADNPGAHVGFLADGTTTYTNGAAGTVDVYLNGGTIHEVFGGSNTKGSIRGKAEQHINEAKDGTTGNAICPLILDEVYGGGNVAYMEGGTDIDLGCISSLKAIYGGARNADVGGDIVLTITSGHFDRVFGGNNLGGCIRGSILVNIEETGCNPITIGELYGCGNKAAYSIFGYKNTGTDAAPVWEPRVSADDAGTGPASPYTSPKVNVKSFTSIGNIFGGGLGQEATVVGDPTVNIDEIVGANAEVSNWQYNGSTVTYNAGTADEYKVKLPIHTVGADKIGVIGTVYGGGNAAPVIGNTNVNIGTQSEVEMESLPLVNGNKQKITVKGVDIKDNVFGGGLGSTATVSGNTNVVVGK